MLKVTVLGGPHDGKVVDYAGPCLCLPVPTGDAVWAGDDGLLRPVRDVARRDEIYELRIDEDHRAWYVRCP
jgi:hypothetical protein